MQKTCRSQPRLSIFPNQQRIPCGCVTCSGEHHQVHPGKQALQHCTSHYYSSGAVTNRHWPLSSALAFYQYPKEIQRTSHTSWSSFICHINKHSRQKNSPEEGPGKSVSETSQTDEIHVRAHLSIYFPNATPQRASTKLRQFVYNFNNTFLLYLILGCHNHHNKTHAVSSSALLRPKSGKSKTWTFRWSLHWAKSSNSCQKKTCWASTLQDCTSKTFALVEESKSRLTSFECVFFMILPAAVVSWNLFKDLKTLSNKP